MLSLAFGAWSGGARGRPAPRLPTRHTPALGFNKSIQGPGLPNISVSQLSTSVGFYLSREPLFHVNEACIWTLRPEPPVTTVPDPASAYVHTRSSRCQFRPAHEDSRSPSSPGLGGQPRLLEALAANSGRSRGGRDQGWKEGSRRENSPGVCGGRRRPEQRVLVGLRAPVECGPLQAEAPTPACCTPAPESPAGPGRVRRAQCPDGAGVLETAPHVLTCTLTLPEKGATTQGTPKRHQGNRQ